MLIREAKREDAPGIARVQVDTWNSAYKGIVPDEVLKERTYENQEKKWLRRIFDNPGCTEFIYVAAADNGEIAGFSSGKVSDEEGFSGNLYTLYILKEYQKQGIGSKLLKTVALRLISLDAHDMLIWAFAENSACSFYEKLGGIRVCEKMMDMGGGKIPIIGFGWKNLSIFKDNYWDDMWQGWKIEDYKKYINLNYNYKFVDIFIKNNVQTVCDAACGFGKFSSICSKNNFTISGFDISSEAVNLTKAMLKEFNLKFNEFKVCSLTEIDYDYESFDGAIAHAVMDHLKKADAVKALDELLRIVKKNGLIYFSFDGIEDDDLNLSHMVLEDGSFEYTDESRKGMIFRHFTNDDIIELLNGLDILLFEEMKNGTRNVIVKK